MSDSDPIQNKTNNSEENLKRETKKTDKKSFLIKYGGLLFIIAIIAVFILLAVSGINFGQWLANLEMSFFDDYGFAGIYWGIFIISIFGNFTVIFPVPYAVAIIVISTVIPGVNPFLLGLVAGLGASIGEISAYLIGRGSKEFLKESESMIRMKKYVDRGWAPLLIIIFAATPLPDDAFLIVLGFVSYNIALTLIFCFIGKFILCFLLSAAPTWLFAFNPDLGNTIMGLFGIDIAEAQSGVIQPSTPEELIISTITWILTIAVLFALLYIDWEKLINRFKKKNIKKNHLDNVLESGIVSERINKNKNAKYHPDNVLESSVVSERIKKIAKLFNISKSVRIDAVANVMGMNQKEMLEFLTENQNELHGIVVYGDYIKITSPNDVDEFIEKFNEQFKS
ncbi:MAG: YqaA family protein [Promethearchaeota archaeon]